MSRVRRSKTKPGALLLAGTFLFLLSLLALSPAYANGADDSTTLSGGKVTPDNGTWGSTFTFEVTYTDSENTPPEMPPTLCIDNEGRTMSEKDPEDSDFTDGKVYQDNWIPVKEDVDNHEFYFYMENARDPENEDDTHGLTVEKRSTSIIWEVDNPEPARGENVTFSGQLRTSDDNLGVDGENVVLYELLPETDVSVDLVSTDENGQFTFSVEAPSPGISVYGIGFSGDNYYCENFAPDLWYVNTLDKPLVLGVYAVVFLAIVGVLMFLLSRGLVRARYLKPVFLGFVLGFFLSFIGAGIFGLLLAGGVAGYLFAKRTGGWTKHLRVGCMIGVLILLVLGILSTYLLMESPEFSLSYSVTQTDLLYPPIFPLVLYSLFAGLAAAIGGMLRGRPEPSAREQAEQFPTKP